MVRRLIISNSQADFTSHAGLGLVGMALERCTNLAVEAKAVAPVRTDAMPHKTMLVSGCQKPRKNGELADG